MTAVAHAPASAQRSEGFAHQPALDGLRGVAVLMVVCFHGGWSWMSGGYVGVSVFFTLSGFLITRLLLDEHDRRGRVDVVRFWTRRLRRLAPASLACLLAVGVFGTLGAFGDVPDLGRDILGALLQLANWFSLTGETSYAEQVLATRSPLDHFWSLAIEEQFYWLWPLVMVAVMRRGRPDRAVLVLTALAMVAAPLTATLFGGDAAYWATPARAGEILVGASLAAVLHRRAAAPSARVGWLGMPALAIILWAAVAWPSASGPAYEGWLPVFALASGALILSIQVRSPLRRALAWRPLTGLGVISYGVYLYHWPVFLVLDDRGNGPTPGRFLVQVVVTVAIAAVSYRWFERPIRRGAGDRRTLARPMVAASIAVVVVASVGSFGAPDRFADPSRAASQLEPVTDLVPLAPLVPSFEASAGAADPPTATLPAVDLAAPVPERIDAGKLAGTPVTVVELDEPVSTAPTEPPAPNAAPAPPVGDVPVPGGDVAIVAAPQRPVRILVVGDSTAWSLGDGLAAWTAANPEVASVTLTVSPGCGFVLAGRVPADDGAGFADQCQQTLSTWLNDALLQLRPDVVMLMATRTDVKDREWNPDEGVLTVFDPRAQERIRADYARSPSGSSAPVCPRWSGSSRPWSASTRHHPTR
jgi:peptidoglycan/LPS O-acetylase OafA/YrhL